MQQCLMIKTKDKRQFFTYEKHLPQLIEFSKIFNAEISVVKIDGEKILDLEELPEAICNSAYKNKSKYELISEKIGKLL
jgi:hypothetical protein